MSGAFPPLSDEQPKQALVASVRTHLESQGFTITEEDASRPWGAFLRIVNNQADDFLAAYFPGVNIPAVARQGERSPKILLVAPHQRLSWQHHDRRSEFWRVVSGAVGIYASATDTPPPSPRVLNLGDTVELAQGTRHRLAGLDHWGGVAEIWIHSDPHHPSDENDLHEIFLMTDDLDLEMTQLKKAGVACEEPSVQGWGRLTRITLPGGGKLGLYQPRHARP